ncbi:MAG: RNA polymerase sigma factor [Planctomycetaceae bacterium]|jgi:RNA polymerase sigma-70 factor (ECF subfamily)|nr:RNA polymerase sigma factor [Planctomycetaceae bacterium]
MNAIFETNRREVNSAVNYDETTDEELLLNYREKNDRNAFEVLVKRYERELYNYLRFYLGNADMAEDVFQTTFFLVHQKCRLFDEKRAFRPWIYKIATNQAVSLKRHKKIRYAVSLDDTFHGEENLWNVYSSQFISEEADPCDSAVGAERKKQVRDAVEQLPESHRKILYLVYFQGMKYREAAETLGLSSSNIKSRLSAAIKKLQNLLPKATA